MTNPYAPPTAVVQDVLDPAEQSVLAERGARLAAAILDSIIFIGMVYLPLVVGRAVNRDLAANGAITPDVLT